jgi:peptidoglycan-N-acetylglucosamine deacetylase
MESQPSLSNRLHIFSVIVPAFNEEYYISECLESLRKQDYSGKFEIIVVDNGSADNTAAIARKHGAKVKSEPKRGVSLALIKGCSKAKGEILVFTDADTRLPSNWLTNLNNAFNSHPQIVAVGGPYHFFDANVVMNVLVRIAVAIYVKVFHRLAPGLPCSNMAVKKETYVLSGGFNPQINWGQDSDLCGRLKEYGLVKFDPEISVDTSFRRFSGGHISFLLVVIRTIKELIIQLNRYFRSVLTNKIYTADKPIRFVQPSFLKKLIINGMTALAIFSTWVLCEGVINPTTQIFGSTIFQGKTNQKVVALTFDDGPYGNVTNQILDILKNNQVKATFFVTGKNAQMYPDILKREVNEGHTIGNHSYDHSKLLAIEPAKKLKTNISNADNAIFSDIKVHPRFFRPPYGLKSPQMIRLLNNMGYKVILWDDATNDYNLNQSPEAITNQVLKKVKPGAIIDLHDGRDMHVNYPRENLIKALPCIIDSLKAAGYQLVTLDQLIEQQPYFR